MPSEPKSALTTSQRGMDAILLSVKWRSALLYLGDIFVFSESIKQHLTHLQYVLTTVRDAGITRKLKTCSLVAESTNYLGHVIHSGRLEVAESPTDVVRQLEDSTRKKETGSFLVLCNAFRRLVSIFLLLAALLSKKLRKNQPKSFLSSTIDEKPALERLTDLLTNLPVLSLPRVAGHYTVDAGARGKHVFCVSLLEELEERTRLAAYLSRTLKNEKRELATMHRECLAVASAVLFLRPYLESSQFNI